MLKELVSKCYAISVKMSLGAILFRIATANTLAFMVGVSNLPGFATQLKITKFSADNYQNRMNYVLTQTEHKDISMKLVSANNKFAFQLFSEILKSEANKNIFISPMSIAIALSMTYNGAQGETKDAMAKTLNFQGMSLEEVNQANKQLWMLLDSLNPEVKLDIANSIWTKKGVSFNPNFLQNNQNFYQSQLSELDFNNSQAPAIINNWVHENTHGKIEKIIETLEPDSVMVLLNAIYFKGNWGQKFSDSATQEQPFNLPDGSQKQHPIMFQSSRCLYYEDDNFQAVSLPYGEGRVSMYIFLPRKDVGLAGFYQILNDQNWESWMLDFDFYKVNLGLPKFKNEYEIKLNDILKSLGMAVAFDKRSADFSGMRPTPPELYINEVKHKTFVEVNEEGTEAGASTSVAIGMRSVEMLVDMVINRPFFFAIRDNDSGSILFMGEITNPQS